MTCACALEFGSGTFLVAQMRVRTALGALQKARLVMVFGGGASALFKARPISRGVLAGDGAACQVAINVA